MTQVQMERYVKEQVDLRFADPICQISTLQELLGQPAELVCCMDTNRKDMAAKMAGHEQRGTLIVDKINTMEEQSIAKFADIEGQIDVKLNGHDAKITLIPDEYIQLMGGLKICTGEQRTGSDEVRSENAAKLKLCRRRSRCGWTISKPRWKNRCVFEVLQCPRQGRQPPTN